MEICMAKFDKNRYLEKSKKYGLKFVQPTPEQIESWLLSRFEVKMSGKDQIRINNPFDANDEKFHCWISKDKAAVHDFRPGFSELTDGSFIRFVAKYRNISIADAIKEVCGGDVVYKKIRTTREQNDNELELPAGSKMIHGDTTKLGLICRNYLNKRGFSDEIIERAKIHYHISSVVLPYYQYDVLVFWQSRSVMNKKFKFPDQESTKKAAGDFLYGFDDVNPSDYVIVTEANFNALSVGENSVATGGAGLKDGQIRLLKSLNPHTVILAPDNDDAGIKSLQHDYMKLLKHRSGELFSRIEYVLPPKDVDWNDMLRDGNNPRKYIMQNKKKMGINVLFGF